MQVSGSVEMNVDFEGQNATACFL